MSIYSGYPRIPSKILSRSKYMKILNQILIDAKVRNLEFDSVEQFNEAVKEGSYLSVDCHDVDRVQMFYDAIKSNPKLRLSNGTLEAIKIIEEKLQIFRKLGT